MHTCMQNLAQYRKAEGSGASQEASGNGSHGRSEKTAVVGRGRGTGAGTRRPPPRQWHSGRHTRDYVSAEEGGGAKVKALQLVAPHHVAGVASGSSGAGASGVGAVDT